MFFVEWFTEGEDQRDSSYRSSHNLRRVGQNNNQRWQARESEGQVRSLQSIPITSLTATVHVGEAREERTRLSFAIGN